MTNEPKASCCKCGSKDDLAKVYPRVPGKATQYMSVAVVWCKACRIKNRGVYRLAY